MITLSGEDPALSVINNNNNGAVARHITRQTEAPLARNVLLALRYLMNAFQKVEHHDESCGV